MLLPGDCDIAIIDRQPRSLPPHARVGADAHDRVAEHHRKAAPIGESATGRDLALRLMAINRRTEHKRAFQRKLGPIGGWRRWSKPNERRSD